MSKRQQAQVLKGPVPKVPPGWRIAFRLTAESTRGVREIFYQVPPVKETAFGGMLSLNVDKIGPAIIREDETFIIQSWMANEIWCADQQYYDVGPHGIPKSDTGAWRYASQQLYDMSSKGIWIKQRSDLGQVKAAIVKVQLAGDRYLEVHEEDDLEDIQVELKLVFHEVKLGFRDRVKFPVEPYDAPGLSWHTQQDVYDKWSQETDEARK